MPGHQGRLSPEAVALPELVAWAGLNNDELARLAQRLRKPDTMPPDTETAAAIAGTLFQLRAEGYHRARVRAYVGRLQKGAPKSCSWRLPRARQQ